MSVAMKLIVDAYVSLKNRKALEEMRARYLLTYSPNDPPKEGYHTLNVTLKNARGDVTARPGYFVGAPPSAVR